MRVYRLEHNCPVHHGPYRMVNDACGSSSPWWMDRHSWWPQPFGDTGLDGEYGPEIKNYERSGFCSLNQFAKWFEGSLSEIETSNYQLVSYEVPELVWESELQAVFDVNKASNRRVEDLHAAYEGVEEQ